MEDSREWGHWEQVGGESRESFEGALEEGLGSMILASVIQQGRSLEEGDEH